MGFQNGSQICLGNDNCIRSIQIWVNVCTVLGRMMSFCDDLWSEPSSQVAECNVESATRDGYLLLASSVRQSPTIIDNELKQASLIQYRRVGGVYDTRSYCTLLSGKVQGPSQVSPVGLSFLIGVLFCITIYGRTRERVSVPQEYLGRRDRYWRQG